MAARRRSAPAAAGGGACPYGAQGWGKVLAAAACVAVLGGCGGSSGSVPQGPRTIGSAAVNPANASNTNAAPSTAASPSTTSTAAASKAQFGGRADRTVTGAYRRLLAAPFTSAFRTVMRIRVIEQTDAGPRTASRVRRLITRTVWQSSRRFAIAVSDPLHPRLREILQYDGNSYIEVAGRGLLLLADDQDPELRALRGAAIPSPTHARQLQGARAAGSASTGTAASYEAALNTADAMAQARAAFTDSSGQEPPADAVALTHNRFAVALSGSPALPTRQALREEFYVDLAAVAQPATDGSVPQGKLEVSISSTGSFLPGAAGPIARPRPRGVIGSLSELAVPLAQVPSPQGTPQVPQVPTCATPLCA